MPDDLLIEAFTDAIRSQRDAEEFERLMLGKPTKGLRPFEDSLDLIALMRSQVEDATALAELRASPALERLQGRYPELWEQVVLNVEAVDG